MNDPRAYVRVLRRDRGADSNAQRAAREADAVTARARAARAHEPHRRASRMRTDFAHMRGCPG